MSCAQDISYYYYFWWYTQICLRSDPEWRMSLRGGGVVRPFVVQVRNNGGLDWGRGSGRVWESVHSPLAVMQTMNPTSIHTQSKGQAETRV